ncbi:hypothetical protein DH2020_025124 [Rehmannia glutinosa]|uniref:Uncharacterized protein n=1 Tax=Rehmannia glutinosa TaxID=99300 RepID=A0ABR0W0L3_REHGL
MAISGSSPLEYPTPKHASYANVTLQQNDRLVEPWKLTLIGTPLQVDSLTASRTRLSMARVCVELDLLKERIEEVILEFDGTTHVQKIVSTTPPVRRPAPKAAPDGQAAKGRNKNIEKLRGTMDNSKILNTENTISNPGINQAATKNQAWIMVNKKGPRETRLVSKELLNFAKLSKHTYFEGSHSNEEGSGTNRFSILQNGVFEPLDELPQLIKGRDEVTDLKLDAQDDTATVEIDISKDEAVAKNLDGRKDESMESDNSIPSLSSFEKNKYTHGHNSTDLAAGVTHGEKGGVFSENISPAFSKSTTPFEGFIGQIATNGNLQGPTYTPIHAIKLNDGQHTLAFGTTNINGPSPPFACAAATSHVGPGAFSDKIPPAPSNLVPPLEGFVDQLDTKWYLHEPTSTPFHAIKVKDAQQTLLLAKNNQHGPYTLPCTTVTNPVGPDVFLPPLNISAHNFNLVPPHHFPSPAFDTPRRDDGSRASLAQKWCLVQAQVLSSPSAPTNEPAQHSQSAHLQHDATHVFPSSVGPICLLN